MSEEEKWLQIFGVVVSNVDKGIQHDEVDIISLVDRIYKHLNKGEFKKNA